VNAFDTARSLPKPSQPSPTRQRPAGSVRMFPTTSSTTHSHSRDTPPRLCEAVPGDDTLQHISTGEHA